MGKKINPIIFRLGVYRPHNKRWFARRGTYAAMFAEDQLIVKYVKEQLANAEIAEIEIEKTSNNVRVIIHSARPGLVIGKKGLEIDTLRKNLTSLISKQGDSVKKNVEVSVQEVKNPALNASLVAQNIADQIENRASFKKVIKKEATSSMRAGAKGINIRISGRLGGAEIAREEIIRVGSVPRHTLRSDIDYGTDEAHTTYGIIGVKVWICRGDYSLV